MTHDLCGCCDIREKLKAMWERLQTTIYGIRVNGVRQIPDGQGIIDIEIGDVTVPVATNQTIGGVKSSANNGKVSVSNDGIMTANGLADAIEDSSDALDGVEQLEAEVGALQTSVEGHTTQIGDLETALEVAESDIDELDQDVVRIDGQIDSMNTAIAGQQTAIGNLQTGKQNKLTAGQNITITGNVISASGGGGEKQIYTGTLDDIITLADDRMIVLQTFDLVFVDLIGNIMCTRVYAGIYQSTARLGCILGPAHYAGYISYSTIDDAFIVTSPATSADITQYRIYSDTEMYASFDAAWAIFV